ncbi:MAG: alpha/beta hydrolase family protein [Verrucomicrobiia bacterium]|jgi:fermentation-respiration switch protein FrsA (DUF1100 family)
MTANSRISPSNGRLLGILLATVILASFLASRVQTSGGRVAVYGIKIPTQNGQWLAADLFKPRSATSDRPAPLVVVVPGFQRSKETLSNISLELARRGIVVIAIDPYAQGGSSSSTSRRAATTEGYGMFAVVDYAHDTSNLNYIDKTRIGTTGHSAGGNAAIRGANYFGKKARKTGQPSKLHSVFVSGYVLTMTDKVLKDVRSNVGMSYALYDEGAYRNELENGDMRTAPEALRLVNSGLPRKERSLKEVELGHYYGDSDERTMRVIHNERTLHPFQPYDREATANQIEFFERVFDRKSGLASSDQIWRWKELFTLASLVAAMLALIPFARMMLAVPFFSSLAHPVPNPQPRPRGRGRLIFWGVFALSALIACFSYIPFCELSQKIFVAASNREQTWFFPQRMNNAVMMWAVLNGVVGFLLFFMTYRFYGKRNGIHTGMWGVATSRSELTRTAALAATLFGFFFVLLFTVYYLFHVDYRFVFLGARVFRPATIPLMLMYVPLFLVFFLSNSLRVNGGMRFEGQAEWKSMLFAGVANTLGLALILVIQYVVFAVKGTVFWTDGWLYVNLLFAVVPIMFVLPIFNRCFFRITGRIYLGPLTMCLIFITILLSNTVCYIPL